MAYKFLDGKKLKFVLNVNQFKTFAMFLGVFSFFLIIYST